MRQVVLLLKSYLQDVRRMEAADDVDEDELLDGGVEMSIQDSCQTEGPAGSGRYRHRTVTI